MNPVHVLLALLSALPRFEAPGAPPPLAPSWYVQAPGEAPLEVPQEGMVLLPAWWQDFTGTPPELALAFLDVTVIAEGDAAGDPLPGDLEWLGAIGRPMWRSHQPLSPSGAYTMTITARNVDLAEHFGFPTWDAFDASVTWRVLAAAEPLAPLGDLEVVRVDPQTAEVTVQACCDASPGLCAPGCGGCGAVTRQMPNVHLTLRHGAAATVSGLLRVTAWLAGPAGYRLTTYPAWVSGEEVHLEAVLDVPLDSYCIQVEVTQLVLGESRATEVCLDPDALPPFAWGADVPAEGACFGGGADDTASGCAGGPSPRAAWPVFLAALLALAHRRRARQAGGSRPGAAL